MQALFEGDAADGFAVVPDVITDGLLAFVDGVIPVLQERGLFRRDYETETLRGYSGSMGSTACACKFAIDDVPS